MKIVASHGWPGLWVARQIKAEEKTFNPCYGFEVKDRGATIGAVVFHDFRVLLHGNTIHMSAASTSPRWVSRRLMRDCVEYVFVHLNCVRVETRIRASERELEDMLRWRIGFRYEGKARCAYDGKEAAIVLSMLRDEIPEWLKWRGSVLVADPPSQREGPERHLGCDLPEEATKTPPDTNPASPTRRDRPAECLEDSAA